MTKKFLPCEQLYGHFFGFPWIEGGQHLFLFTEQQLITMLQQIGFKNIKRVQPTNNYLIPGKEYLHLAMEATK